MKHALTTLLLLISLSVSAQKYALWHKPTKMYVNVRVDSFKVVQRKDFSYYLCYAGKYEISMFTKPGARVEGYLKKRL